MKQYRIFYKRASAQWGQLEPILNIDLYDVPVVKEAIQVLREHPAIEAICVRHEDAMFNIITFTQDALAPKAFILGE